MLLRIFVLVMAVCGLALSGCSSQGLEDAYTPPPKTEEQKKADSARGGAPPTPEEMAVQRKGSGPGRR